MKKEKVYLESAKKIVAQCHCGGVECDDCPASLRENGNTDSCNYNQFTGFKRLPRKDWLELFSAYIAEHERKPAKSPVRKSVKRFHANGGTLGWKKEEVRYFLWVDIWTILKFVGEEWQWTIIDGKKETGRGARGLSEWLDLYGKHKDLLEVAEADLDYLRKPDGDWEFRKVGKDDEWMHPCGTSLVGFGAFLNCNADVDRLSGYRWCKPRKKLTKAECMELAIEETWEPDCSVCYKRAVEIYERLLEENGLA